MTVKLYTLREMAADVATREQLPLPEQEPTITKRGNRWLLRWQAGDRMLYVELKEEGINWT